MQWFWVSISPPPPPSSTGDLKEMQLRHEVLVEQNESLKEQLMDTQDDAREATERADDLQG